MDMHTMLNKRMEEKKKLFLKLGDEYSDALGVLCEKMKTLSADAEKDAAYIEAYPEMLKCELDHLLMAREIHYLSLYLYLTNKTGLSDQGLPYQEHTRMALEQVSHFESVVMSGVLRYKKEVDKLALTRKQLATA